jgi:A/G-specific adenine glycosylase
VTEPISIAAPPSLVKWFAVHRRDLPWRTPRGVARDPWKTLVSEVMSQQTRLEVVVPRFLDWMRQFPSPRDLADAQEDVVLGAWAGLGYYSRARNLHKAAKAVAKRDWPADHAGVLALPGVGPYTAAALASLCLGQRVAMVDGNVLRVLSRVHALGQDLRNGAGKRRLEALATDWVARGDVAEINEATMELGAMVCLPRNPKCGICPLAGSCKACAQGDPERFPAKKARPSVVEVVRDVVVASHRDGVYLRPSRRDELLRGLLVPPDLAEAIGLDSPEYRGEVRHAITHHKVRWRVFVAQAGDFCPPPEWDLVAWGDLPRKAVSSLVRKSLVSAGVLPGD